MKHTLPLILLAPALASAQQPRNFADLVFILADIISLLVPLIFGLTLVVLIWGITKAWILRADDAAEVEKGKKLITISIVVLVIMSGIWGILSILRSGLFG